ncbi:glycerophosphoryl diester phosphodiesterase [Thermotomaculum hydrothermale]|uniref:Glycerophosphoryl diester phosphodiesterase n=1 Tax=Thermotomaculum hydrothermale TaxID=981385 RepID=A0A7R6SZF2_9BACT|nr:glycerophosphodiester phosphodiesterase [Thermotomaculum hydrothermale]BBB32672.1 glycerophosphoryl diester phosphodiesterase [Thermotomaculum hydrothermale]
MNEKFRIIGHRGAKGEMPENSLEGFEYILKNGIQWAEIDLRLNEDGEVVLHHDKKYENHIANKPKNFRLLPKLKDALNSFPQLNFNLELKESAVAEKLTDFPELKNNPGRFILSSFHHHTVKKLKKIFPDIPCLFLISGDFFDLHSYITRHKVDGVVFEHEFFSEKEIKKLIENGKQVYCYSVDDVKDVLYFYNQGINGIITNYPVKMKKYLETIEPFKKK